MSNIVIKHPPGTHHRLPRSWLEQNGRLVPKPSMPEYALRMWQTLEGEEVGEDLRIVWEVTKKAPGTKIRLIADFVSRFGEHMMWTCEHGNYNYKDCLKIMEENDETSQE